MNLCSSSCTPLLENDVLFLKCPHKTVRQLAKQCFRVFIFWFSHFPFLKTLHVVGGDWSLNYNFSLNPSLYNLLNVTLFNTYSSNTSSTRSGLTYYVHPHLGSFYDLKWYAYSESTSSVKCVEFVKPLAYIKSYENTPENYSREKYAEGGAQIVITEDGYYIVTPRSHSILRLILELSRYIISKEESYPHYSSFYKLFKRRMEVAREGLSILLKHQKKLEDKIVAHAVLTSLGLGSIFPIMADENIEEFYIDSAESRIYVDHTHYGRLNTNLLLTSPEINALITHLKLNSDLPLNSANPTLKTSLITDFFHYRFNVDIPPLVPEGPAIDARSLRSMYITPLTLLQNDTISPSAFAFLVLSYIWRRNISILGEPGAGKTTLANAIDLCSPKDWRKIYLEDSIETPSQTKFSLHQLKIEVPYGSTYSSKTKEVLKLLHRNPTYIYLGEIQFEEQAKALFHALSSGLRVIHTIHSKNPVHLLKRLHLKFQISPVEIGMLDLLVYSKDFKWFKGRRWRVIGIYEIKDASQYLISPIFSYLPHKDRLLLAKPLSSIRVLHDILSEYSLSLHDFNKLWTTLTQALSYSVSHPSEFRKILDEWYDEYFRVVFYDSGILS
ncbi:hypothetical protein B6U74_05570 [Candidatus Bathyarchaeota archaeon ex4484_205]|nr:MAG: hypothetical protein B6U74_05570 [Candidatus Bathyarchaeota archaeon ex4484_205]RLG69333.1 MAG: hypothetical protein DRN93_00400 [archaeon]